MKRLYDIAKSFWTLQIVLALTIAVCVAGSLVIPRNLAIFTGIDDTPLFRWLAEVPERGLTWWVYALVVLMGAAATSTAVCTIDALVKSVGRRDFLSRLLPQVMHIGVLVALLGHLLTAAYGLKYDINVPEGETTAIHEGMSVSVSGVRSEQDETGYYTAWEADVAVTRDGATIKSAMLRPVHPILMGQTGLFFKSISVEGQRAATIRVTKDPGARWALAGGILVAIGAAGFIIVRRPPPGSAA